MKATAYHQHVHPVNAKLFRLILSLSLRRLYLFCITFVVKDDEEMIIDNHLYYLFEIILNISKQNNCGLIELIDPYKYQKKTQEMQTHTINMYACGVKLTC